MRLKRIRLFGFKTFADKVDLDVDGNMIAVVGPNGCGKSNLVDAVLWGLGESSVKSLRAQSSQDVIFNGSQRRKPLGYAEVQLVFDNEDGALPIDTSEVVIGRKLTRNGDSDYSINRRNCRQRDVYDLLADSGLGRAGYAIVGQREIDAALAASAEERRMWIDEAAGVQRYRARRIESLRRLESTLSHLSRVEDILNEIELQREPLREQAEVAKKYRAILDELRQIECGYLMREIAQAVKDIDELDAKILSTAELGRKEQKLAEELEVKITRLGRRIGELEREIETLRALHQDSLTAVERADAAVHLSEERLKSLDEFEENIQEESESGQQGLFQSNEEIERVASELKVDQAALDALRADIEYRESAEARLREQLEAAEESLDKARKCEAERHRALAEAKEIRRRRSLVEAELKGIEESVKPIDQGIVEAEELVAGAEAELTHARAAENSALSEIAEVDENLLEVARQIRSLMAEVASIEGRRKGIAATLELHEGLAQGAKATLEASANGTLKHSYIPLSEAIQVEHVYAKAIEIALGEKAHDLIVPNEDAAKDAIDYLKLNRLGRATFQPLTRVQSRGVPEEILRFAKSTDSAIGVASELVQCENAHRPIIETMLGRIVVVTDLESALRLPRGAGWTRLVTLQGEVVHANGAVTGGESANRGAGILQRRAEAEQLARDAAQFELQIAELNERQSKLEELRKEHSSTLLDAREKMAECDEQLVDQRRWLMSLRAEQQAAARQRERLMEELTAGAAEIEIPEEVADINELERERNRLLELLAAQAASSEHLTERVAELQQRILSTEGRLHEAHKRSHHAEEAKSARERRLQQILEERWRLQSQIQQQKSDKDRALARTQELGDQLAKAETERKSLSEERDAAMEDQMAAQRNATAVAENIHKSELARARADSRRTSNLHRLLEEYGVTQPEAIERAPSVELPSDSPGAVTRMRRELRALGDVNLGAIDAFEKLTERYTELNVQREDILAGKADVEAGIRELDKLTRERFLSTFEAVREAFKETFQKLFGGGEAIISLDNPDNLLETGVDVEITVPGKKRQRLELLSGGERSMSAIAFLMALLTVKPSPLVILDEVDAPLDGRNVERFVEMLQGFTTSCQFLLITHNEVTIRAAPIWFGVTMQEPGVSTIVPFRTPEPTVAQNSAASLA